MNPSDARLPELNEAEGERFLADLDAALSRKAAPADHPQAGELRLALRAAAELPASGARPSRAALPPASRRSSVAVWLAAAALIAFAAGCFFTLLIRRPRDNRAVVKPEDRSSVAESPDKEKPQEKKKEDEAPAPKPAPLPMERLEDLKALRCLVSFELEDTPLVEALNFVSSLTTVSITLDPDLAAASGEKRPVKLRVSNMPLYEALTWIAKLGRVTLHVRDGQVFVRDAAKPGGTQKESAKPLEVYDVRDIDIPAEKLADSIQARLFAREFAGKDSSIAVQDGKLVVVQGTFVHDGIRDVLAGLRATGNWPPPGGAQEETWKVAVKERLEKKVSLEFKDSPFGEVLGFLDTLVSVNIISTLDERQKAKPITIKADEQSIMHLLDTLTHQTGTCYVFKNHAICITTPEQLEAETPPELRVYDVSAIAKEGDDAEALPALIRKTILPASWDSEPGTGIVELGKKLVVRHKPKAQALVDALLKKLAEKP